MKKVKVLAMAAAMGIMMAGCGQSSQPEQTTAETVQETSTEEETESTAAEKEETTEEETAEETTAEAAAEETAAAEAEQAAGGYEDNFAVDSAAAADFAGKIQAAVADKDLEGLADLIAFPVYVGLPDVGAVESRDEFIALGADQIFTSELMASVAAADTGALSPSMAGFVLSDGGKANIIFGVTDGALTITGINY